LEKTKEMLREASEKLIPLSVFHSNYKSVGLSRLTIISNEWHELNPEACHTLFGFSTWTELKEYHDAFFPDKEIVTKISSTDDKFSFFEKSLIWLMRVRTAAKIAVLVLVFGRSRFSIGRYLKQVGPMWKDVGLDLCQLDTSESFLKVQVPQQFIDAKMTNVAALNDGKDFKTETVRVNSFFTRAGWSSKVEHSAFRVVTYSLPYGLVFLVSPLYFGRATEGNIVSLLGRDDEVSLL
jgi:hypothetical protein